MGILASKQSKSSAPTKRRSAQLDFSNLAPLKSGGTVGFSTFRDNEPRHKARKKSNGTIGEVTMAEDSDEEEEDPEVLGKMEEIEDKDEKTLLSPEDAKYTGELAEGVGRIKLKRQHSEGHLNAASRKSPGTIGSTSLAETPPVETDANITAANPTLSSSVFGGLPDESAVGSPLKKHRASLYDMDNETMQKRLGMGFGSGITDVVAAAEAAHTPLPEPAMKVENDDEEL